MSTTEPERLELYELAKHAGGERFAELMMKSLPSEPDQLVRRADLAATEQRLDAKIDAMARDLTATEQRLDASIDVGSADLRTEMRDITTGQTRTLMLGLVGSVTALSVTEVVVNVLA